MTQGPTRESGALFLFMCQVIVWPHCPLVARPLSVISAPPLAWVMFAAGLLVWGSLSIVGGFFGVLAVIGSTALTAQFLWYAILHTSAERSPVPEKGSQP